VHAVKKREWAFLEERNTENKQKMDAFSNCLFAVRKSKIKVLSHADQW
jgi:hypothetical protein